MRKRHLLTSMIFIAITTLASVAIIAKIPKIQAATPVVSISTVVIKQSGVAFKVNISVTGVTDLNMWVVNMTWDPNITKVATGDTKGYRRGGVYYNIYEGPFLKSFRPSTIFLATAINNTRGTMREISGGFRTSGTPASGSGVLAIINFTSVNVGTTTLDINGPSIAFSGQSMLIDSAGHEIPHVDVNGAVLETEPPPPPIWTEAWFQTSVIAVAVVGAVIVAGAYTVKKRKERGPGPTEEEELKQLLEAENQ